MVLPWWYNKNMSDFQKRIWENKVNKGFNTTNVDMEFCLLHGEVAEAFDAYHKGLDGLGEELADSAIFLYGLAEMVGVDLEAEIEKKIEINKNRVYKNGVKVK